MKVCCFIQARVTSTRFPGKVWKSLNGTPVITRVTNAAYDIAGVDEVRVLWAHLYPHLDENDVLARYSEAAREYKADVVMRLTGDCPLFDPQVGSLVLKYYLPFPRIYDYVSNVWPKRTWPDGLDCEVFSADLLHEANRVATSKEDREHVTPWMQRWEHLRYKNVTLPVDWSSVRLTLDTPEDLVWLSYALSSPKSS